jgi:hypothetical protein
MKSKSKDKEVTRVGGIATPSSAPNDREYLRRILPLDFVEFTSMPEFKKELRRGEFIIGVLDLSNHHTHNILTRRIVENLISK